MNTDYTVLWDGTDACPWGRSLVPDPPIPPPDPGVRLVKDARDMLDAILHAFTAHGPMTVAELRVHVLEYPSISDAVQYLHQVGRLEVVGAVMARGQSRPRRIYRVKEVDA
jgi:hypothetical protein